MVRFAVPALFVVFGAVALALPLARLWWRHGTFGFVGDRDPVALAFAALVAGAAAYLGALAAFGPERLGIWSVPPAVAGLGLLAMVGGIGVAAVAQAQMGASWRIGIDDRPTGLVVTGLYRWTRHPIYSGLLVFALGVAVAIPSPATLVGVGLAVAAVVVQARREEAHLLRLHGDAYREWAARVGRFGPW